MQIINAGVFPDGVAVALGAFDGIHIGHKKLIDNVTDYAKSNGCKSCVFTFDMLPSGAKRIICERRREALLESMGVDYLYVQHFDSDFKNTSAKDFMDKFLTKAKYISVGFNFRFGRGREGDVETLKAFCSDRNISIDVVGPVRFDGDTVSSTRIRRCIEDGDFDLAKAMLGYNFYVEGTVVKGNQMGRTIKFPTANIVVDRGCVMPDMGVYITVTEFDGKLYQSFTNYGGKPTFDDDNVVMETHIFDFDGDLYGKSIKVYFAKKIRNIQKFESAEALKTQLLADKNKSLDFFSKNGLQI